MMTVGQLRELLAAHDDEVEVRLNDAALMAL